MFLFNDLIYFFQHDLLRAIMITISLVVILGTVVWVSVLDMKYQKIKFWKMIVAGASIIIMPLITSFFCGCNQLKWYLLGALGIYILFLFVNVLFNNDRFIGKADIDLFAAVLSLNIMFSLWINNTVSKEMSSIMLTGAWYSFVLYFLSGALFYLVIFFISFFYKVITKKIPLRGSLMGQKISVIPMLLPLSVMVPYLVMTA